MKKTGVCAHPPKQGSYMKNYAIVLLTFWSFGCQAFNCSLVEEKDRKILWYRQLQLEGKTWELSNVIKQLENDPLLIFEKIDDLKRIQEGLENALGFPEIEKNY